MHTVRGAPLITTVAMALALLGCNGERPLGTVDPSGLLGHWATSPADLSPQGWHQYHLTFTSSGSYRSEVRSYGLYEGQPAEELSGFSLEEGRFRTEGDRLAMEAERLVVWDRFYGANSPARVHEPYPYGDAPLDGARFEIRDDRLILHYLTYPADAPVPTSKEYRLAP